MKRQPWITGMPARLETERFIVRSMGPNDATDNYMKWIADPELMRNLNTQPMAKTRDEEIRRLKSYDNSSNFQFGVFVKPDNILIGFFQVRIDKAHKLAEVSVVIGNRDWWGRDVVLEARGAIIDFLFDRLKLEKIWGMPQARNFAAIANYRKQGFRLEGVLRGHNEYVYDRSKRLDFVVFSILKPEWHARRTKEQA
ncbi:MAG: GNAT family protein [Rhodospirillales bacterium]